MNFPSSVRSICLVIVVANFLRNVAQVSGTCMDPSNVGLPNKCPAVSNSPSLVIHKVNDSAGLECTDEGRPVVFAYTRSVVVFHCCFSGYTSIRWLFSRSSSGPFVVTPACLEKYENRTWLIYSGVQYQFSGFYRCEAVGRGGERLSVDQELVVFNKRLEESIKSPRFDPKCDREIDIIKGSSVECLLKVSVTRKTKIRIIVEVGGQRTATCIYKPYCDRLHQTNLTGVICHRNSSSNLQMRFQPNKFGSVLRVSLLPIPGLPSNVTFIVCEATLPRDTTVWSIRTKPVPSDSSAVEIVLSSSMLIFIFAAILTSTWIFAFNLQLIWKGLRYKHRNVRPSVRILCHPGNVDIADDFSDYLESTCDIREDLAGVPDCEITMRTGLDKTCILLILLDVNAVSHEPFIASMNSLLLRESTGRVYACLDSINTIKQALGNEDSKKLVKRIIADLKFCNKVPARRRHWKWVRWQVLTCLKLAAISILCKVEPEITPITTYPSTSSDSGLGSICSDSN